MEHSAQTKPGVSRTNTSSVAMMNTSHFVSGVYSVPRQVNKNERAYSSIYIFSNAGKRLSECVAIESGLLQCLYQQAQCPQFIINSCNIQREIWGYNSCNALMITHYSRGLSMCVCVNFEPLPPTLVLAIPQKKTVAVGWWYHWNPQFIMGDKATWVTLLHLPAWHPDSPHSSPWPCPMSF